MIAQHEAAGALARGYRVSQGREMGHDARIVVCIDPDRVVWVGGRTDIVVDGRCAGRCSTQLRCGAAILLQSICQRAEQLAVGILTLLPIHHAAELVRLYVRGLQLKRLRIVIADERLRLRVP